MATLSAINKPLFGPVGISYFGDKRQFCSNTVSKLVTQGILTNDELSRDAESVLKSHSASELMRKVTIKGLPLDELVPVHLNTNDEADQIVATAARDNDLKVEPAGGEPPENTEIAIAILQIAVLHEVCGPNPELWNEKKSDYIQRMRQKHGVS